MRKEKGKGRGKKTVEAKRRGNKHNHDTLHLVQARGTSCHLTHPGLGRELPRARKVAKLSQSVSNTLITSCISVTGSINFMVWVAVACTRYLPIRFRISMTCPAGSVSDTHGSCHDNVTGGWEDCLELNSS